MKSTQRFSNRVANYVKYRPSYPQQMVDHLSNSGVSGECTLCDIGSGTGILSELLADNVHTLYALEPNTEMRQYAESLLSTKENYFSKATSAEETGLADSSVDIITVAQAFHWFDHEKCRTEFKRILKPKGKIFLIWNNRISNTPFLKGYDKLLHKYGTDYAEVNHQNITDESLREFLGKSYQKASFANFQEFDLKGFTGRALSSSYSPDEDHPKHREFLVQLKALFDEHNREGLVLFNYRTEVYTGELD